MNEFIDYYHSKLNIDKDIVKKLLIDEKLINATDALKYNFVSNILDNLPSIFKNFNSSMII